MILDLNGYILDVAKDGASPQTIRAYNRALERIGISQVDTDKLPEIYKALEQKLKDSVSYVYVKHFLAILFAYYKDHFDEPPFKGIAYKDLSREIKLRTREKEEYSDEDIKKLFTAARRISDGRNTWRAAVLCFYAGLRISGCQSIRWDSVKPVDDTDCVTFRVRSKGKEYNGILSKEVWNIIDRLSEKEHRHNQSSYIVNSYADKRKSQFDKLYRSRLMRSIASECPEIIFQVEEREDGAQIVHKKSPYHSLRKSYAHKLNAAGVSDQDLRYLMNHTPVGVTFSHYIYTQEGKQPIDLVKRMVLAYQRCEEFMHPTLIYGLDPVQSRDIWIKKE